MSVKRSKIAPFHDQDTAAPTPRPILKSFKKKSSAERRRDKQGNHIKLGGRHKITFNENVEVNEVENWK